MNKELIIVTGYFGAPIEARAAQIAEDKGFAFLSLDKEIQRRDGRSVGRIVRMAGEHGYRNQEYEILNELNEDPSPFAGDAKGLVVACGDGVLYDDMSRQIAESNTLVIIGGDMTADQLWTGAKAVPDSYHAFMAFGSDEQKRRAFDQYISRQKLLFAGGNNDHQ
ncbi:MAG: shikimate kinase [Bacillota bacterium]|nr:shikimate kinase [Bacillota bacterium]